MRTCVLLVFAFTFVAVACTPSPTVPSVPPTKVVASAPTTVVPTSMPTMTPMPTDTPSPTATFTPKPTDTPRPTVTPMLGIGSTRISPIDGAMMVFVPAGEFLMGSSDVDKQAGDDEKPQHTIYLDAFWIDKFEVTNALYKKCVDAGKCLALSISESYTRSSYYGNSQFDNYPVIYVSWDDANAFCGWAGKKLPTEAQWEKAARGTDGRVYPWGNTFDENVLNSAGGGKGDTSAVGSYSSGASPYGAMDMAGNVWEWVADWYNPSYYASAPRNNPKGPSSGRYRVVRGGSWYFDPGSVRAANRLYFVVNREFDLGFRCVE